MIFFDFSLYLRRNKYNPWGILLTSASKNNLLYTAREFDSDTALQFNRMRYYNASLGRFMQKDLIFSQNKYNYSYNIPTIFSDPFGMLPLGWGGIPGSLPGPNLGPLENIGECLEGLCEDCGRCWSPSGSFWHCDKCPGQNNWEYLLVMFCYEYLAWLCIPSAPF